jgi:hypothetical protein
LKFPLVVVSIRDLLSPYSTRRKRSGDRGNPYLIPLSNLKKEDVAPFISISKETKMI